MAPVIVMKTLQAGLDSLSAGAYALLLCSLRLCCAMLLLSALLLGRCGGLRPDTYELYRTAAALQSHSASVLLLGNAAALLLEQAQRK